MDSLNANKPLPKEMILNSAENHFYRIGLSLASVGIRVATCPELCGTVLQMRLIVLRPAKVSRRTHLSFISKLRLLKY